MIGGMHATISDIYPWEGDDSVLECLVFYSNDRVKRFEESGDPTLATFRIRAVKFSDGMFRILIRDGLTGEELTGTCLADPGVKEEHAERMLRDFVTEFVSNRYGLRNFKNLPNTEPV